MAGQFLEHRVGQHLAGAVVAGGAQVVRGGLDSGQDGVEDLQALRHQVVDQAVRGIVPDRVTDSEDRGVARRLGGDPFNRDQVERERHLGHDVLRAGHGARDIAVVQRRRDRNSDDVGIGPERRLRVCEAADPEARGHLAAALHGRLVEHHLAGAERDQITKAAAAHGAGADGKYLHGSPHRARVRNERRARAARNARDLSGNRRPNSTRAGPPRLTPAIDSLPRHSRRSPCAIRKPCS